MRCGLPGSQEAINVIVEFGAGRVWGAEVRKRVRRRKRTRQYAARTPDALQLRLGSGALEPEAVAVLETTAGFATLGGNDDCSVRRIDETPVPM